MCNQAVGLVAAELERRGIATVCLQLLELVARAVRPPRALLVPFAHGYPLGAPLDARAHHAVLRDAFTLLARAAGPPALARHTPAGA